MNRSGLAGVLVLIVMLISVSVLTGAFVLAGAVHTNCVTTQDSWDSRRETILTLTELVEYAPTTDAELRSAQRAANTKRVDQRRRLMESLGDRPDCSGLLFR